MNKVLSYIALIGATILTLSFAAFAANGPYDVNGVRVDASADSASAAREIALAQGYQQALTTLMKRNTLRQNWQNLPTLSEVEAQGFVRSFSIIGEKTSRTRYLARLNVSFKANGVRNLLRQSGVPFSETVSKPVLVLPVWQVRDRYILWGDPNPWRAAWEQEADGFKGLLPIVMPDGELDEMQLIDGAAAVAGDQAALDAIAKRHGVAKVAVSHGRLLVDRETDESYAQIVTKVYGAGGVGEITDQQFVPAGSKEKFFRALARGAIGDLNEDWKAKTLVRFGQSGQLAVRIPVSGLEQWVRLRKEIENVAAVQKVTVGSLSVSEAWVQIDYRGGISQLAFSLNERNLALQEDGQGGYTILPRR
ncbi:MAG: DUF2066 domain-containing protein [Alphaproteobacteria bacterium]